MGSISLTLGNRPAEFKTLIEDYSTLKSLPKWIALEKCKLLYLSFIDNWKTPYKVLVWQYFFFLCMQITRHTRPEGHFKVWATTIFSRGSCHLLLGLKQGYPFYSPYGCRLGYHQSEAWQIEQKALPPQFYVASVTTGIRTHTLLIKHQNLNLSLFTKNFMFFNRVSAKNKSTPECGNLWWRHVMA